MSQLRLIDEHTSDSGEQVVPLGSTTLPTTPVFETYWRFAAERQAIFFRRVREEKGPWTADPVLMTYKFTNPYRASDRVSQFLIGSHTFAV